MISGNVSYTFGKTLTLSRAICIHEFASEARFPLRISCGAAASCPEKRQRAPAPGNSPAGTTTRKIPSRRRGARIRAFDEFPESSLRPEFCGAEIRGASRLPTDLRCVHRLYPECISRSFDRKFHNSFRSRPFVDAGALAKDCDLRDSVNDIGYLGYNKRIRKGTR